MKKSKITLSILALSIFSSNIGIANAKTEGLYVGANVSRVSTGLHPQENGNKRDIKTSTGFGLDAKYAFNKSGVFIAPGTFVDFFSNKYVSKYSDFGMNMNLKSRLENRYGLKVDAGYDVTNNFAPYITAGISEVGFKHTENDTTNKKRSRINHFKQGNFFGFGSNFHINDKFTVNAEFNTQNTKAGAPIKDFVKEKYRINIVKVGGAYHF
jgi:opacity protein-like surface antigen